VLSNSTMITVPETGYLLSCHNDVFLSLWLCTCPCSDNLAAIFFFFCHLRWTLYLSFWKSLFKIVNGCHHWMAVSTTFNQSLLMCILAWDFLHV
jgi:hypothetical protein